MKNPSDMNGVDAASILRTMRDASRIAEEQKFPVKLTLRLNHEQHEALRRKAYNERRAISEILREFIDELAGNTTKS